MSTSPRARAGHTPPASAVVVGAGVVGLSTAWFLQERGVTVTVLDKAEVAAGASWGNAGWLSPALAVPLTEPATLRYGVRTLSDPEAPLYVPLRADRELITFLMRFGRNCTPGRWRAAMVAVNPLNRRALDAYDQLQSGHLSEATNQAPIVAVFRNEADEVDFLGEVRRIRDTGFAVHTEEIDSTRLRSSLPFLAEHIGYGVRIVGQRFLNPGRFVAALAESVRERGGVIRTGTGVGAVRHGSGGPVVELCTGDSVQADAVVLSTGVWLPYLAKPHGVRTRLRGGRGYSFSVSGTGLPLEHPVYLPEKRVALTPWGRDRVRVAGTMEFRKPDEPLDPRRAEAIVRSIAEDLPGMDWSSREETWVGSRPVTADGLPLIGETRTPDVYVAGGHGMWGLTQGPVTGLLLADQITTGTVPELLRPFDPLR